jgi:hypothetical protein
MNFWTVIQKYKPRIKYQLVFYTLPNFYKVKLFLFLNMWDNHFL